MPAIAASSRRAVFAFALMLALLSLLSCSRPAALTMDELEHETLGTSMDLRTLLAKKSVRTLGIEFPEMETVENVNEKDWYEGKCTWESKIDGVSVNHDVSIVDMTGVAASDSIDVMLSYTDSALEKIDEIRKKLPGTGRGLRLGSPVREITKLYGAPTRTQSYELGTNFFYELKNYKLVVMTESRRERVVGLMVMYFK
jgi:hypothetical protein